MEATKLELWCEQFWRDHGFVIRKADRQLAYTDYELADMDGHVYTYRVALVIPSRAEEYKKDFAERWEAAK